jgi:LytS/YehU family sensor histidine kinase
MASEHLREFENKVAAERERLQEEKERTKQCLTICTNTLEYIAQLQFNLSEEFSRDILMPSEQATANALQECKDILTHVSVGLQEHIQEIKSGLQSLSGREAETVGEDTTIRTV